MYDFIKENKELHESSQNLDTFCNFANQSLKLLLPKLVNQMETTNNSDGIKKFLKEPEKNQNEGFHFINFLDKHLQTSHKISDFLTNSMMKISGENSFCGNNNITTAENVNHSDLNDSYEKPSQSDMESKLNKFKEFMFNDAKKLDTNDLLNKIVGIIEKDKEQNNYFTKGQVQEKKPDTQKLLQNMFLASFAGGPNSNIDQNKIEKMATSLLKSEAQVENKISLNTKSRNKREEPTEEVVNTKDVREDTNSIYTTTDDVKKKVM
jgi:hypothetical protein